MRGFGTCGSYTQSINRDPGLSHGMATYLDWIQLPHGNHLFVCLFSRLTGIGNVYELTDVYSAG